ncbi:phasin family protein [Alicyclobacillus dauci]|uniref:Polyhydroxyalkanoate synthesis regulator phasin n=1 Tax=Alicyclobacillus dauci TaxID=1475485 RepID=A0ABY6Z466_9BACL|nr:hypothetical protein [Alicyclobacillus dauci]WAH37651.1 hypothetical protein NZD86_03735 [Alicyclobacillus dauci]
MDDTLRKMVDLGVGFITLSRDKITETAKQWAEERKLTPTQTRELIQAMVERGEQGRSDLQQSIQEQVQKTLHKLGIREDHDEIRSELAALRELMSRLDARIGHLEEKLSDEADRTE